MNKLLFIGITVLLSFGNSTSGEKEKIKTKTIIPFTSAAEPCLVFDGLNTQIRDGQISKKDALKKFQTLIPLIKNYYYKHGGQDFQKSSWIFPLQNYNSNAIGGKNGDGYKPLDYDYFAGNKHAGHPAQDIFINDNNQDCLDDKTKKPVTVLSMTEGIVIATSTQWNTTSKLRGGKYIFIYQPGRNSIFYYAHNNKILVRLCDIVKPGNAIATVGRTGLNAFKKRSPTHLHIMRLKLDNSYYPKSINLYKELLACQTLKK